MGAVPTQEPVDILQLTDQIENFLPIHRSTGRLTKMGPTAEGAGFINQALSVFGVEEGAGSVVFQGKRFTPRGPKGLGGQQGLPAGELWDFSREAELAALRSP